MLVGSKECGGGLSTVEGLAWEGGVVDVAVLFALGAALSLVRGEVHPELAGLSAPSKLLLNALTLA